MKPYYQDEYVTIYNADCRDVLSELPEVDLVMTDPPYGIGESSKSVKSRQRKEGGKSKALANQKDYGNFNWDNKPISQELFDLVCSKGKYFCVWGGNYYVTQPSKCWLVWDKQNGDNDFADCELAYTNYPKAVRMISYMWNGMLRKGNDVREHPTQKPVEMISWAIKHSPKYETILDPFMGSGTTLRAAKDLNRKAIGIELEEKYCEIATKRMQQMVLDLGV